MPHSTPPLKATDWGQKYEVGDIVEVKCDYERKGERRHGWIRGIIVQSDPKMVAVQFRANVYLTDGWMVPDHILWYPITSPSVRPNTRE